MGNKVIFCPRIPNSGTDDINVLGLRPLEVVVPAPWLTLFSEVSDSLISFANDKHQAAYRFVSFVAYGEAYRIATNRLDLTARWQIELFFRFIKRTFNALHLWSHSGPGVEIQFYLYLIVYVLLIHFKQGLQQEQETIEPTDKSARQGREKHLSRTPERGIVTLLGKKLAHFWKISIHWLKSVQNLLLKPLTPCVAMIINAYQ